MRLIDKILLPLALLTGVVSMIALAMIFFHAPVEATMGIVQKIFYVHVPAALAAYAGFAITSLCSMGYLIKPSNKWLPIAARTGADVGMIFCIFMLISGPLWALKAWGKAWTWDPQLTASFILFLLYGGYIMLRSFGGDSAQSQKVASVLAIIAFIDIPVIHYAVKRWGGLHPVVERSGGQGLADAMKSTFSVSMLAFLLLFALMFLMLYKVRLVSRRLDHVSHQLYDLTYAHEMAAQER